MGFVSVINSNPTLLSYSKGFLMSESHKESILKVDLDPTKNDRLYTDVWNRLLSKEKAKYEVINSRII